MDRWRGKLAIVTGASAGIGAAISETLVKEGLIVVGLARRVDRVEELAKSIQTKSGGKLHAFKADIRKEEDIIRAFEYAIKNFGPINVLINNAGVAVPTTIIDGKTEDFKTVLDTNILGLTIATREAIKNMITNNVDGHIININSIMGHYVALLPLSNVYPASKHGVTALTETLRQELFRNSRNIKVTSISPGYVKTDIVNGFMDNEEIREAAASAPFLNGNDIGDAVVYVLGTPPHVQITELTIRPVGEAV